MSWTFSNTPVTLRWEQWQEDWAFRLLSLLSFLLTRGGRRVELTLIVPQLIWKDIFSTLLPSAIYSCWSYVGFSNEILPKTDWTSASLEISGCISKKYINLCLRRRVNDVFLTCSILLKFMKLHELKLFICVIFWQLGFRNKYQKHYFHVLVIIEDTAFPFWGSCWCLHYFELPRNME